MELLDKKYPLAKEDVKRIAKECLDLLIDALPESREASLTELGNEIGKIQGEMHFKMKLPEDKYPLGSRMWDAGCVFLTFCELLALSSDGKFKEDK